MWRSKTGQSVATKYGPVHTYARMTQASSALRLACSHTLLANWMSTVPPLEAAVIHVLTTTLVLASR